MAKKESAGILLYRVQHKTFEVLLVHPGGPFWKNKDEGSWSIPKGEFVEDEQPLSAAIREFEEETGKVLSGEFIELLPVKQKGGKVVHAWALQSDIDAGAIRSNVFEMEWPPRSGKLQSFPEVDKAAWFNIDEARSKINQGQISFLDQLVNKFGMK